MTVIVTDFKLNPNENVWIRALPSAISAICVHWNKAQNQSKLSWAVVFYCTGNQWNVYWFLSFYIVWSIIHMKCRLCFLTQINTLFLSNPNFLCEDGMKVLVFLMSIWCQGGGKENLFSQVRLPTPPLPQHKIINLERNLLSEDPSGCKIYNSS